MIFTEREGREKERGRNINRVPLACPQLGTWPTTQAYALAGKWTSDLWVCRPGAQFAEPHQPRLIFDLYQTDYGGGSWSGGNSKYKDMSEPEKYGTPQEIF